MANHWYWICEKCCTPEKLFEALQKCKNEKDMDKDIDNVAKQQCKLNGANPGYCLESLSGRREKFYKDEPQQSTTCNHYNKKPIFIETLGKKNFIIIEEAFFQYENPNGEENNEKWFFDPYFYIGQRYENGKPHKILSAVYINKGGTYRKFYAPYFPFDEKLLPLIKKIEETLHS